MNKKSSLFNRKNVVVTGGEGFIGRSLVSRLESNGARVVSVDEKNGFDVCKWDKLNSLKDMHMVECLYHLAAVSFVPYAWKNPRSTYNANILSTLNILDLCRTRRIKKLVLMSSYVYGQPKYLSIDEAHSVSPANPYMWSKYICENLCRAYAQDFGLKVVILRPFNVYGNGQRDDFLIPSIIKQARTSNEVVVNDIRPKRDFLYIDDMVEALLAAGNYDVKSLEIFNIGYGKSWSVKEIVEHVAEAAGKKIKLVSKNIKRKGEILDLVADISKAEKSLRWRPKIGLNEGIKRIWKEVGL
ncbi:MAG: NAD-dependent epimerase/dehydratase family protein [Candidatus Margulisiibacteriota bacterium]